MGIRAKRLIFILFLFSVGLAVCLLCHELVGVCSRKPSRSQTLSADLNGDGKNEQYILERGQLKVSQADKLIWQTDDQWWVDSFFLADSDNNGVVELNISLWKKGRFGSSKPFWIEDDQQTFSNHFFVYKLVGSEMKMVWGSSDLKSPNCSFEIYDYDQDGKNELVVIEGVSKWYSHCVGTHFATWRWNGWGFTNLTRTEL